MTTPPPLEENSPIGASFFPVPIDSLSSDELGLDLYLLHGGVKPVLYRSTGSAYSMSDCAKLAGQGVSHLYVPTTQHRVFQRVISDRLVSAYEDQGLERAERTRIVRASCGKMIEDLMQFPHVEGITQTIGEMAGQFSAWCTQDEDKFSYLLDMSEHDYYTITHMVNVGVGCGMLGVELLGPDNPLVRELVHGGLMHDIGKRGVPTEILNKEGKLSDDEWLQVRAHPEIGLGILSRHTDVSPVAIEMTGKHHERLDGLGYPNGLSASDIGLPARICAVVDIYDALTAARPYRGPIPPQKVLASLREEVGTVIDKVVFEAWERVVNRLIKRDPQRATPDRPGVEAPKLRGMMPSAPKQARPDAPSAPAPVSQGPSVCEKTVLVSFAARLSVSAPAVGAPFEATIVMISRTGLKLRTDVRAAMGEVLRVPLADHPPRDVVVRRRCYGPAGEAFLECDFVRPGRHAA